MKATGIVRRIDDLGHDIYTVRQILCGDTQNCEKSKSEVNFTSLKLFFNKEKAHHLTKLDYCDSIDYRNSLWRVYYERKAF